jgi:hypothetical protein
VGSLDEVLHPARLSGKRQITFRAKVGDLPDGTFVNFLEEPWAAWLVWRGHLRRWSHEGYGEARAIALPEDVLVLTPAPTVRVLASGYAPGMHPTLASALA